MDPGMGGQCMPMVMTFCSTLPIQLLWSSWNIETQGQYAGAIIFCIVFGWLRHALARLRQDVATANNVAALRGRERLSDSEVGGPNYLAMGASASASSPSPDSARDSPAACADCPGRPGRGRRLTKFQSALAVGVLRRNYWLLRLVDVLLFGCISTVGFLNMLVVMAFNPGLMMAIVGGEMLGVLTVEPLAGLHADEPLSALDVKGMGCH